MGQNKIKVLFFSRLPVLSSALASLFCDEVDFSYRALTTLDGLSHLKQQEYNGIIIIDLSKSVAAFHKIVNLEEASVFSLPFIFVLNNRRIKDQIDKRNFTTYDIIFKPFRFEDLLSKIRVLTTNLKMVDVSKKVLDGNYFDFRKNEIKSTKGGSIKLTQKENEIVNFLFKMRGEIVSKKILLKNIWGYNESVSTHTLETHIYRLRKKIQIGLGEKDFILNDNKGYYLSGSRSRRIKKDN